MIILASMSRISDLAEMPFEVGPVPRGSWANGDYVVVEVLDEGRGFQLELATGRLIDIAVGDRVLGALGRRHATLEATGSWELVGEDGRMELLTGGGLLGRCSSRSALIAPLPRVEYRGHVLRDGRCLGMGEFVEDAGSLPDPGDLPPVIMIIGTSMSAGKTSTARALIRLLTARGLAVLGAKVAGAGRYRDILTMADSGAAPVLDFVDAGLPSTVCPAPEYGAALDRMLCRIAAAGRAGQDGAAVDVAVVEVGASPLEPYNGELAMERLRSSTRVTVLCASDPYAVVGIMHAFEVRPDFVTGIATNTIAGVQLVQKLAGIPALNVKDPAALPAIDELLSERLGLDDAR